MLTPAVRITVALFFVSLAAISCGGKEKEDWDEARAAGTTSAYEAFLTKHPTGSFATDARSQLEALTRPSDWKRAQEANTAVGYEEFLSKHPSTEYTDRAKALLRGLTLAADWSRAKEANTAAAYDSFLTAHPDGREADVARSLIRGFEAERKFTQLAEEEAALPIPRKGGHTIDEVKAMLEARARLAMKLDKELSDGAITKTQHQELVRRNRAHSLGFR